MIVLSMTSTTLVAEVRGYRVGDTITSNAPGRVGHNYARWRVISSSEDGIVTAFRV